MGRQICSNTKKENDSAIMELEHAKKGNGRPARGGIDAASIVNTMDQGQIQSPIGAGAQFKYQPFKDSRGASGILDTVMTSSIRTAQYDRSYNFSQSEFNQHFQLGDAGLNSN